MTTITESPVMSDDLWNALFVNLPAACRVNHCWAEECPADSHDETDGASEA